MATLVAFGASMTLAIVAAADEAPPYRPAIHFAAGVPDDVQELASSTWERFLNVFPARWECLPNVRLRVAWQFATRAAYDPDRRLVTVRVPATAPNLRATMVHEFAHHLEYTCPNQRELRPRVLAAQGLPPETPWRRGEPWTRIPAEQFAQATIQVVLGPQPDSLVLVRPALLNAIREWGRGR
jgi:hypothetical protein